MLKAKVVPCMFFAKEVSLVNNHRSCLSTRPGTSLNVVCQEFIFVPLKDPMVDVGKLEPLGVEQG